jgi:spermidine synthase
VRSRAFRVSLLLFGSGLTALVYQIAWMRELRLVFGFSTAASAAVVAIFMGGLGIGSWILGRRADEAARPLAFYGKLELAIAGSAAVTPALLWLVRVAYISLGGSAQLGLLGGTLLRILFSALVLAVPTVLMGGTLPAATRAVETEEDPGRRLLALLYGSNTLGAVAGTLVSTFYLLEALGTRRTLWAGCVVNAFVGLAAVLWSRPEVTVAATAEEPRAELAAERAAAPGSAFAEAGKKRKKRKKGRHRDTSEITPDPPALRGSAAPTRFVLAAAAITGFAFTLMELVWYRMLAPLLGGSTYTFGLILAVALLGVGLGSLARSSWKRPGTLAGFAATCALEAGLLAVPYGLGDSVAILAARLHPTAVGFGGLVWGWAAVTAIVVFPAAFLAGLQFPILISLLGRGREKVGTHVGLAYAWNTAGAILGSLAGGFGLLPLLSAPGTWVLVTLLLAALALAALLVSRRRRESAPSRWGVSLGAAAASVALVCVTGPTAAWRHSPIGAGRVDLSNASPNRVKEWVRDQRRRTFWEADGVESSVAMQTTSGGLAFAVSGKIDGNSRTDAPTQVMGGLIGAALHPGPRRALVIGLGTGSTAGWLAGVASIERVDVVELEPVIRHVARACAPVNRNVLENPRVRVVIGDAREYLLASRERYDIIFSEPSNPYRAGVSSLFTEEFYRAASGRLAPGGIFLQWLQAYEVDTETVRTVYATLQSAFPAVESWYARRQDLVLAATAAPISYDAELLRARLAQEPFRSALTAAWATAGLEGFLSHFVARSSFVEGLPAGDRAPRNTDDKNVIEFAFTRSLGGKAVFDLEKSRALARGRHEDTPVFSRGRVDWDLARRLEVSTTTADGVVAPVRAERKGEELRQSVVQKSFLEGRPDMVLAAWREQPWEPVGQVELAVVSQALAEGGDETAVAYIDRLRETSPAEADALLAQLRWRQGRHAEATGLFEKAYARYREDPWPLLAVMNKTFLIVADIAGRDPALADRLEKALAQPFAVLLLNEERLQTRYKVATYLGPSRLEDAMLALEPHMPWRKGLLSRRAKLYESTRNPRAELARREHDLFLKNESEDRRFPTPRPGVPAGEPESREPGNNTSSHD